MGSPILLLNPSSAAENAGFRTSPISEDKVLRRSPRSSSRSSSEASSIPSKPSKKAKLSHPTTTKKGKSKNACFFVGDPIPIEKARQLWPRRYEEKGKGYKRRNKTSIDDDDEEDVLLSIKCHYALASIVGCIIELGDCVYVKGQKRRPNYVGRILEFFETMDEDYYFTVQWFFRAEDTILKDQGAFLDEKRLFYSDLRNDNLLSCIVSRVKVIQVDSRLNAKSIPPCDFYYDMKYSVDYSTFCNISMNNLRTGNDEPYNCVGTVHASGVKIEPLMEELLVLSKAKGSELKLLDLYSGCGAMSTGLCIGAKFAGINLVTRWAVDFNEAACETVKLNHPEIHVWNESAEDFFELLKEWKKLSKRYADNAVIRSNLRALEINDLKHEADSDNLSSEEYEVSRIVGICYGDPNDTGKRALNFKVRWKGYGRSDDTWESFEVLRKCQDAIREFIKEGLKSKILPLPGDVDVICGGPPCQGISGYNRHRNTCAPLDDERNHQVLVFMNIVKFLQPKYILMENVVDILKFANGIVGRYALSQLVSMNYQARLGIMAAGCYGLPQFRLRVFLWGAHPNERLPQFPLPTHDVVLRGGAPIEFERNIVAYDEEQSRELEKALFIRDAISDLPSVENDEIRDEMPYDKGPETEFQRFIRSTKDEMTNSVRSGGRKVGRSVLYDHLPLQLNEDDYYRVCKIPQRKGANFRDFPGIIVGADNKVMLDQSIERVLLPSGKPLVPDYALTFVEGKSRRPFARLWWDETVPTVLTCMRPNSLASLHPVQNRILTVRECARLQGIPDYYKLCGTVKERYRQVGNAVAVPVARALGYALAMAWLERSGDDPVFTLPPKFFSTNS